MSVLDGNIVQVGDLETIKPEGKYELDESFENLILMPGLVEGHSHLFEGALWSKLYCGYFDRQKPDGTMGLGRRALSIQPLAKSIFSFIT